MSNERDNIELIEAYLDGRLEGEELSDFLHLLNSNEQLKLDVETQKLISSAIHEVGKEELLEELQQIHQDIYPKSGGTFSNMQWILLVLAVASLIGITTVLSVEEEETQSKQPVAPEKIEVIEDRISKESIPPAQELENAQTKKKPILENDIPESNNVQAGEIIMSYTGDFIPDPELIISDTLISGYLFNGKDLTFFNLDQMKIEGVINMEMEKKLYLLYDSKCYYLKLTSEPKALIEEKDPEIIRYLRLY